MGEKESKLETFRAANAAAQASPTAGETPVTLVSKCGEETPKQSKVLKAYFARKKVVTNGKGKNKTKTVSFFPIQEAVIGYTVYVVVETAELTDGEISIEIKGNCNNSFIAPDETASFSVNGSATSRIAISVGNYSSRHEYCNAASLKEYAIAELKLNAESEQSTKDWIAAINETSEKRAFMHLDITASGGTETLYFADDDNLISPNSERSIFYNKANEWFALYGCLCGKELQVLDLEKLGIATASAEKFQEGLACIGETYGVNTCLRAAHFLSQLKHESSNFMYVKEIWGPSAAQLKYEGNTALGNTVAGDGIKFMGRGLIQITGRSNYTAYGKFANDDFTTEDNNEKLEQSRYAADSAGWYYTQYLDVDLNDFADRQDLIYITYRINGGFTGFRQREEIFQSIISQITGCRNAQVTDFESQFSLESSQAYDKIDAVYKWANLLYEEGSDATPYYQRYLDKTDPKSKNANVQLRRATASSRITVKTTKR